MATKKIILGPESYGYDVTTAAGFLAGFDDQISQLLRDKGWCQEGARDAYAWSGIPRPGERKAGNPLAGLNPDWFVLSDTGRAALDAARAEEEAKLPEYKAGVYRGIVYALNKGAAAHGRSFTQADADKICDALGLERLVATRDFNNNAYFGNYWYFRSPASLTVAQQNQLREALVEAIQAAITATVPGAIVSQTQAPAIGAATQSDRSWALPGEREAVTEPEAA